MQAPSCFLIDNFRQLYQVSVNVVTIINRVDIEWSEMVQVDVSNQFPSH